LEGKNKLGV